MKIYRNMQLFKSVFEQEGTFLTGKLSDCNTSHIEPQAPEHVHQPQHVLVVGDAQISADFIFFNVFGADDDNDLCLRTQLF